MSEDERCSMQATATAGLNRLGRTSRTPIHIPVMYESRMHAGLFKLRDNFLAK
jgi:hypothetical protein